MRRWPTGERRREQALTHELNGTDEVPPGYDVAVVAMNCRFPGAEGVDEFWQVLREGRETISWFSEEELLEAGVGLDRIRDPRYVPAKGVLEGVELFDHEFFGIAHQMAELMDPQQRLFLEFAWSTLERAGYDTASYAGRVGIFAGQAFNTYLLNHLRHAEQASTRHINPIELLIITDKDFLTTQAAFHLGLNGPAVTVQTACSTSMVGIHLACQSLLAQECDLALAGAITVYAPQKKGYIYEPGGLVSPDGHVRPFDAKGQGTTYASGMGLVVLKRLEDALADGDHIHAVCRGTAVNNDGDRKTVFKAPSVSGITEVVTAALEAADIEPSTIGYVEGNGSGNPVGDAVEVEGLTRAFRSYAGTDGQYRCALGSVKGNLGHLNVAAGVAAFMKAVLAVERGLIPPSLNFDEPHAHIDFDASPFYVCTGAAEWPERGGPRRAAVNSYGVGGTNAHAIVEQAPEQLPGDPGRRVVVVPLSARSPLALARVRERLLDHVRRTPDVELADLAFTLQVGRRHFEHRWSAVVGAVDELRDQLASGTTTVGRAGEAAEVSLHLPAAEDGRRADAGTYEPLVAAHVARLVAGDGVPLDRLSPVVRGGVVQLATVRALEDLGVEPASVSGAGAGQVIAAAVAGVVDDADAVSLLRRLDTAATSGAPEDREACVAAVARVAMSSPQRKWLAVEGSPLAERYHDADAWCSALAGQQHATTAPVVHLRTGAVTASAGGDVDSFADSVSRLWAAGQSVEWRALYMGERRRRAPLPTYPFEPIRCWIDRPAAAAPSSYDAAL